MRKPLGTKLYYTISEVAALTELPPYTLRAWEKEFACLRPRRARGKNRAYRERDIGIILMLRRLLHEERYTSDGAKQRLLNEPELIRQAAQYRYTIPPDTRQSAPGAGDATDAERTAGRAPSSGDRRQRPDASATRPPQTPAELRGLIQQLRQELRILLDML